MSHGSCARRTGLDESCLTDTLAAVETAVDLTLEYFAEEAKRA